MEFEQFDNEHMRKLCILQSNCRKLHVQSEMLKLRECYERIFDEIEGPESDVQIKWAKNTQVLTYPKFISKKASNVKQKKDEENQNDTLVKYIPQKKIESTSKPKEKSKMNEVERKHDSLHQELDNEQLSYLELSNLKRLPKTELINVRESISLEMLWIHQAIQSRLQVNVFHYLFKFFLNLFFNFHFST
jgi:hypothetical protein